MEERTKKILSLAIAIVIGIVAFTIISGLFDQVCYNYSQNGFKVEKEEVGFVWDDYYTGNNLYPDKCPAVKLTIKNDSNQSMYVYGEIVFYKDGEHFDTAYIHTDTFAPGDTIVETVSSLDGVRWNSFESYNWTYNIVYIKCNYV